jgi:acyl carrier protein
MIGRSSDGPPGGTTTLAAVSASPTERELREFLVATFPLADADGLEADASLLEAGVLDSTGVLELIEHLEQRYGITVPDEDLLPENFDSIAGVVRYLERAGSV